MSAVSKSTVNLTGAKGESVKKAVVAKKKVAEPVETKETEPVATTAAAGPEMTPEEELAAGFQDIFSKVIDITTAAKALNQTAKALFKRYSYFVRAQKTTRRRKTDSATGESVKPKPSGFLNPVTLSPEMYAFLDVTPGTEMTRTQVTKRIYDYVLQHALQNPENKRIILPNETLRRLLKVPEEVVLTYFNIQTYMKPHFVKKAAVTHAPTTPTTA